MLRAEQFYANQKVYNRAYAYRQQATTRSQVEIEMNGAASQRTVDSKVETIETRARMRKLALQALIEIYLIELKREATPVLQAVHNRYYKMRNKLLTDRDFDLDPKDEGKCVFDGLDKLYADFLAKLGLEQLQPRPPSGPPTRRRTSRAEFASTSPRNPRLQLALDRSIRAGKSNFAATI
jgi:hypothetical protein